MKKISYKQFLDESWEDEVNIPKSIVGNREEVRRGEALFTKTQLPSGVIIPSHDRSTHIQFLPNFKTDVGIAEIPTTVLVQRYRSQYDKPGIKIGDSKEMLFSDAMKLADTECAYEYRGVAAQHFRQFSAYRAAANKHLEELRGGS